MRHTIKIAAVAAGITVGLMFAVVASAGRNSSGTMSFASVAGGYPYVSGQAISSSGVNANMSEIVTELGDSLSRSGKGGMTAPLRGADGTAALPAFSWTSDTNTGIYRIGADNIGISLGGTKKVDLASGLTAFTDPVSFAGSTTTTGVARHSGAAYFDAAATFASAVTVSLAPSATTDAANKAYVDGAAVSPTFGTNWSTGDTYLYKTGKMVHLNMLSQAGASSAWSSIITVPAGSRPPSAVYAAGQILSGVTSYPAVVRISVTGVVDAYQYDNGTALVTTLPVIAPGDQVIVAATWYATQ